MDNPNLKFITQQMFRRSDNKVALADLYFPQLRLSVEIDEDYHMSQKERDKERTADILAKMKSLESVVDFEPEEIRINADKNQTLESLNSQIDDVVCEINNRIKRLHHKLEWDDIIKTSDQVKDELSETKIQLENAKEEMDSPFTKEEELKEKTERLKELNILLNMDQKDKSLIDNEPEEDMAKETKSIEYER